MSKALAENAIVGGALGWVVGKMLGLRFGYLYGAGAAMYFSPFASPGSPGLLFEKLGLQGLAGTGEQHGGNLSDELSKVLVFTANEIVNLDGNDNKTFDDRLDDQVSAVKSPFLKGRLDWYDKALECGRDSTVNAMRLHAGVSQLEEMLKWAGSKADKDDRKGVTSLRYVANEALNKVISACNLPTNAPISPISHKFVSAKG